MQLLLNYMNSNTELYDDLTQICDSSEFRISYYFRIFIFLNKEK